MPDPAKAKVAHDKLLQGPVVRRRALACHKVSNQIWAQPAVLQVNQASPQGGVANDDQQQNQQSPSALSNIVPTRSEQHIQDTQSHNPAAENIQTVASSPTSLPLSTPVAIHKGKRKQTIFLSSSQFLSNALLCKHIHNVSPQTGGGSQVGGQASTSVLSVTAHLDLDATHSGSESSAGGVLGEGESKEEYERNSFVMSDNAELEYEDEHSADKIQVIRTAVPGQLVNGIMFSHIAKDIVKSARSPAQIAHAAKRRHTATYSGDEESQLLAPTLSTLLTQSAEGQYILYLSDTKTHCHGNMPLDKDTGANRLQLMIYRQLLSAMVSMSFPWQDWWSALQIQASAQLLEHFLEDAMPLLVHTEATAESFPCTLSGLVDMLCSAFIDLRVSHVDHELEIVYLAQKAMRDLQTTDGRDTLSQDNQVEKPVLYVSSSTGDGNLGQPGDVSLRVQDGVWRVVKKTTDMGMGDDETASLIPIHYRMVHVVSINLTVLMLSV
ncbi:hypothetical protein PENSPDRAFT_672046 [Peniophora sp. CONT]|nr:hypothetical protein PENSPDRAFT_672046 [Peniophora sp. CONT]